MRSIYVRNRRGTRSNFCARINVLVSVLRIGSGTAKESEQITMNVTEGAYYSVLLFIYAHCGKGER